MKKYIFVFFLGSLLSFPSFSQSLDREVLASSGNLTTSSDISLSWTLGEIVIQSFERSSVRLTQGFHQGEEGAVSIDDLYEIFGKIKVFPNPADHFIRIEREHNRGPLHGELMDLRGRRIKHRTFTELQGSLDISLLPQGLYLLKLSDGAQRQQYVKIQKR